MGSSPAGVSQCDVDEAFCFSEPLILHLEIGTSPYLDKIPGTDLGS